jgi:hypothetical protein
MTTRAEAKDKRILELTNVAKSSFCYVLLPGLVGCDSLRLSKSIPEVPCKRLILLPH